ncbi:MAG: exo-alpha-sialidase [Bryobacterales bacterium]|nr:exo-alpha-sialidase [Bryobacterales bacterium]
MRRLGALCWIAAMCANAQAPDAQAALRYTGEGKIDVNVHEGRLRPVVGASSYQVMRANRTHPEWSDGHGWTYNHAPMLAHWNGKFYLEYLSNPVGEHEPPGQTLLVTSADGRNWGKPVVVFPPYPAPQNAAAHAPPKSTGYMMHQRMGFFVAPNGKLLISAFYGHAPNPFRAGGIGRVLREVRRDGSFGPIYFARYNSGTPWNAKNTAYPHYRESSDASLREACDALLKNKLITEQWRDEDPDVAGMRGPCSAVSYFHRADGKVVGVCKNAYTAMSSDEGNTWSPVVRAESLVTNNAKVWGQRTADRRYALVYNPVTYGSHRWPLAVSASNDGETFDSLNLINGEVPPRRFIGRAKDFGVQYVRGIVEGNGDPRDGAMWVVYSGNKEDIWISRVPVPLRDRVDRAVNDDFDAMASGGDVRDWNLYSPQWAAVAVTDAPDQRGKSLLLRDRDPYDYARAVRVFQEGKQVRLSFALWAKSPGRDGIEMEVQDRFGARPVRVLLSADGTVRAADGVSMKQGGKYARDRWIAVEFNVDAARGKYDVTMDGKRVWTGLAFAETAQSVERLSLRTGAYRDQPPRTLDRYDPSLKDLPGADEPVAEAMFYVDRVAVH